MLGNECRIWFGAFLLYWVLTTFLRPSYSLTGLVTWLASGLSAVSLGYALMATFATIPAPTLQMGETPLPWLLGHYAAASFITFRAYGYDKKTAQIKAWRISEFTLHFTELLGGWPGAFIGQRYFRHKTDWGKEYVFKITFWAIVAVHGLIGYGYYKWFMQTS